MKEKEKEKVLILLMNKKSSLIGDVNMIPADNELNDV